MAKIKSLSFIIIFLVLEIQNLFAKNIVFSITPYTGIEISRFEEAYYHDEAGHTDDLASLLEWDQKPSVIFGLESLIEFKNFLISADCSTKLPLQCGNMYDSDYWENGLKFNYSESENHIDKAFDGKITVSYKIKLPFLTLKPALIGSYSYISFNGKNGHGWYGGSAWTSDGNLHAWNSEYAHYFPDGKKHLAGIDYENQTFYFMAGIDVSHIFFKRWQTAIGFYFAPFTYTYVKDHHLGKSNNFVSEDYIYNYFKNFLFTFKNDFILNSHISIISVVEGNLQLLARGENYEDGYPNSQDGGESYKAIKIKAGVRFSF